MMLYPWSPRRFVTLVALAGLVLAGSLPASTVRAGSSEEILAAENARVEALLRADYDAVDRLLGEDLTYTHSTAVLDTKAMFLESLRSGRLRSVVAGSAALWRPGEHGGGLARESPALIERLRARLGHDAVYGLCLVPQHRPESAWRIAEPALPSASRVAETPARSGSALTSPAGRPPSRRS